MHARFFHGAYLQDRLKPPQKLVLHGKVEIDPYRPARREMVNPEIELIGSSDGKPPDSTEVGRIVPIYESIGGLSSRMLRRIVYQVLLNFDLNIPDPLPAAIRERYRFPTRREASAVRALPAERLKTSSC